MNNHSISFIEAVENAVANDDLASLDRMATTYFTEAIAGPNPFSAPIKLTPEGRREILGPGSREILTPVSESAMFLDAANFVERARRLLKYRHRTNAEPNIIRLVAEGDSWFEYPFLLHDVIDVLFERYAVRCVSAAGDTVTNMVREAEYLEVIAEEQPSLFLFSGGGNDLFGEGRLRTLLLPYRGGVAARKLINTVAFRGVLNEVVRGYRVILRSLHARFPGLRMVTHGYDYPQNILEGPWINPYLEERGFPIDVGKNIVAAMLDEFSAELKKLSTEFSNLVFLPVTGRVGNTVADWHDALHPNNPGFRRVGEAFIEKIDELLPTFVAPHTRVATKPVSRAGMALEALDTRQAIHKIYSIPGLGYPEWPDFGPDETWLHFDDPQVAQQIRDVISLLERRGECDDQKTIENRLRTRPLTKGGNRDFPDKCMSSEAMSEAIIGGYDIEEVQALLLGYRAARAVGLISRITSFGSRVPRGTGSLVGPGLLLTNCHVLSSQSEATQHAVIMDDECDLINEPQPARRFHLTGEIFLADEALDYAFVSVAPKSADGTPLVNYGFLKLEPLSGKAIKGEPVSIIHHANGRPKVISLRNSYVMGRVADGFYYTTDTEHGSSGALVLNREWQTVALHHRRVPHPTIPNQSIANRGIRISAIMEHLEKRRSNGQLVANQVLEILNAPLPEIVVCPFSGARSCSAKETQNQQPSPGQHATPHNEPASEPLEGALSGAERGKLKDTTASGKRTMGASANRTEKRP